MLDGHLIFDNLTKNNTRRKIGTGKAGSPHIEG